MVLLLAVGLLAVIAYNYLTEMLTALRMVRVASFVQFFNAVVFAAFSVGFVFGWRCNAAAVVAAYARSYALLVLPTIFWFRRIWRQIPEPTILLPWSRRHVGEELVPFAASVWIINLLYNLVGVVDRYMIIHFAPRTRSAGPGRAITTARKLCPCLMISVAGILGGILLPYLSHDWEAGDRAAVSATSSTWRSSCSACRCCTVSTLVLLAAPLLFGLVLDGKYDGGLQILPWTLAYCAWMALVPVAQMYHVVCRTGPAALPGSDRWAHRNIVLCGCCCRGLACMASLGPPRRPTCSVWR